MEIIKSVNYDQGQIIKDILKLHVKSGVIDCDPTYSRGNFYKNTGIRKPKFKFDINPQGDYVKFADCRDLPLGDESISCLIFDPPFLATTGKSLEVDDDSNLIAKRFGVYSSETELHQFYIDSMKEFHRILEDNGILIFKCQDKISSGTQYMSHVFICNEAVKLGYYPKDLFVLLAKSRLVADWQAKNQKNARKFHSYFWVFEKSKKTTTYIS